MRFLIGPFQFEVVDLGLGVFFVEVVFAFLHAVVFVHYVDFVVGKDCVLLVEQGNGWDLIFLAF